MVMPEICFQTAQWEVPRTKMSRNQPIRREAVVHSWVLELGWGLEQGLLPPCTISRTRTIYARAQLLGLIRLISPTKLIRGWIAIWTGPDPQGMQG
jgi:hypothetical protein